MHLSCHLVRFYHGDVLEFPKALVKQEVVDMSCVNNYWNGRLVAQLESTHYPLSQSWTRF